MRLRGLLVSFTVLAVGFCAGRFSLPVFYPVFTDPKKFGWTHAEAVGGGFFVLLLVGVLGPVIGWLADRYSPKAVMLAGCLTVAASLMLLSTTQTLVEGYSFCTLMGIGIAASSLVPASMLIAPWFSKQRGLAVGVINAGVGLGGYIFPESRHTVDHPGRLLAGVSGPERVPRDPAGGHAGPDPQIGGRRIA